MAARGVFYTSGLYHPALIGLTIDDRIWLMVGPVRVHRASSGRGRYMTSLHKHAEAQETPLITCPALHPPYVLPSHEPCRTLLFPGRSWALCSPSRCALNASHLHACARQVSPPSTHRIHAMSRHPRTSGLLVYAGPTAGAGPPCLQQTFSSSLARSLGIHAASTHAAALHVQDPLAPCSPA